MVPHVALLNESTSGDRVEALDDLAMAGESFPVVGREVYNELDTTVMAAGRYTDEGAALGLDATRRNWGTVRRVLELASP